MERKWYIIMTNDGLFFEYLQKKKMKKDFSAIGWAVFVLMAVWFGFMLILSFAIGVLRAFDIDLLSFYTRYMMIFNELGLAVGILCAMFVLRGHPTEEIDGEMPRFGRMAKYLSVCFAVGMIGNLIGNALLMLWNGMTGNEAGNEVIEMVENTDSLLLFLSVVLFAPFLEEFFFRKVLIDHVRGYGEWVCILTSAVLFGLFHGNFTQFFYAAGLGALLAYVYFRSGSFPAVFALHAVFNFLMGYLPAQMLGAESSAGYLAYLICIVVLAMLGGLLFLMHIGDFKAKKSDLALSGKQKAIGVILNPGMLAAGVLMLTMMVTSLFTA